MCAGRACCGQDTDPEAQATTQSTEENDDCGLSISGETEAAAICIRDTPSPLPQTGSTTHATPRVASFIQDPAEIAGQHSKLSPWQARDHPFGKEHALACTVLGSVHGRESMKRKPCNLHQDSYRNLHRSCLRPMQYLGQHIATRSRWKRRGDIPSFPLGRYELIPSGKNTSLPAQSSDLYTGGSKERKPYHAQKDCSRKMHRT